jgi:hypothetical protein
MRLFLARAIASDGKEKQIEHATLMKTADAIA